MNADPTNTRLNYRGQGILKIIVMALAITLLLVACERPLQTGPDDADATPPDTEVATDVAPTDVAPEEEAPEDGPAAPTPTAANGPEPTEPAPTATEEQAAPENGEDAEDESPRPGDEEPTPEEDEATPEGEDEATPEPTEEATEEPTAEPTAEPTTEPTAEPTDDTDSGEERVHVVQAGENLYRIGLQYGISWTELAEYNNIANPNRVEVGQQIRIPPAAGADSGATPAPSVTHVVQPGETLFIISQQYGVSWPDIAAANDLVAPYTIHAGQELTIPGGG